MVKCSLTPIYFRRQQQILSSNPALLIQSSLIGHNSHESERVQLLRTRQYVAEDMHWLAWAVMASSACSC